MNRFLGRYSAEIYAATRVVLGFLFALHGAQKLLGFPGAPGPRAPLFSLMGLAGTIELVCGTMIAIGLEVGWAAFLASGTMAFAYFIAHASRSFWPVVNQGELAVVYCFVFLYFAAKGDGKWAVSSLLAKAKAHRPYAAAAARARDI
jgi:putative oxidoreductase